MPRPFYQSLSDTLLSTLNRGGILRASWDDVEMMADIFENNGGSWYGVAHGNPKDVVFLRSLVAALIQYRSGKGGEG